MPRKPIEEPSTRSQAFLSGQRALQLSDLTEDEKQKAFEAVSSHTMNTRENLAKLAKHVDHPKNETRAKALRAQRALDEGAVDKPYNHEEAIQNTMQHFEAAASKLRRPGESVRGGNFYIEHADPIHKQVEGTGLNSEVAFAATSRLSNKNRPGNEKISLAALIGAHKEGSVTFSPEMVSKVNSVSKRKIENSEIGKTVPFSSLHPEVASAMTHPEIRDEVSKHVKNVDLAGIAKGGMRVNISSAHSILQTGKANDPYTNPKFASYSLSHVEAPRPGTPEAEEYKMRQAHISDAVSGRIGKGQQSLDFYGLHGSNVGHLSNVAPTPIDLHHRRLSYNQPAGAPYAAAGDLTMSAKGDIARGDKKITGEGIEHAVLQDAVHQVAKRVQEKYDLPFTVPARLVNEGSWASTREMTGDDPNPMKKETEKAMTEAMKENEGRHKLLNQQQMRLF